MADPMGSKPVQLATAMAGLTLQTFSPSDASRYSLLVDDNRQHLLQHGDDEFDHAHSLNEVLASFRSPNSNVRFGIWLDEKLIGRVDLNPVDPPRWAIGYWLDRHHLGRGIMTTACRAAIDHARTLDASEIYAAVTDGNQPSVNVLVRLGFEYVQHVDTRTRWRFSLVDDPPAPVMVTE